MKTLDELGISPAPWKQGEWVPYCENNIVRCDYRRADKTLLQFRKAVRNDREAANW